MSTLHCSFVIYLDQDSALLPQFLTDLRAFFQKFPLNYELVIALGKNTEQITPAPSESFLRIVRNNSTKSRAESLRQALNTCKAPFLLILSPEMSTPLGDSFKVLQYLLSDPQLDICWGERYSKKSGLLAQRATRRLSLEDVFNKILKEKSPLSSADPLCEIGGFKKEAWNQVDALIGFKKLSGWYLAPCLEKAIKRLALRREEIFVHDSGAITPSFSLWRARWNLLRQSIF